MTHKYTPFEQRLAALQHFVGKGGVVAVLSAHDADKVVVYAGDDGTEAATLAKAVERITASAAPYPVELRLTKAATRKLEAVR